jgi:nitrogen regulatory protein P-II 1
MKMVTIIIQPEKLDEVREALIAAQISRITVDRITGHGRQTDPSDDDLYRGQVVVPNLVPKVRIEIACNDEFVQVIVDTVMKAARHGEGRIGDGKIFVTPLEQCIRLRTGESGSDAI